MTPAQVAHIMAPTDEQIEAAAPAKFESAHWFKLGAQYARAAVEAALRDAPQAEGWVVVPVEPTPEMIEAGKAYFKQNWDDLFTTADHYRIMLAARPSAPTAVEPDEPKSLNAKIADQLRPFLKPGDKVIWREAFRWHDDNGVLSNHYDSMDLPQLADDFGYEVNWDTNMHHAAIVRASKGTP